MAVYYQERYVTMSFSAQDVKALRDKTGAGMMDCKKALTESDGNVDKAVDWLREKGIASAAKRQGRTAAEGAVTSYIHLGGRVGVLAEINCETDFVAKGEAFQQLCNDICLQICSMSPLYVTPEEVSEEAKEAELKIYRAKAAESGKPANIHDKIAEGMLKKWLKDVCLMEQVFVKDNDKTISELVAELSGKVGEKIGIRRFVRFECGEGIDKPVSNLAEDVAAELKKAKGN